MRARSDRSAGQEFFTERTRPSDLVTTFHAVALIGVFVWLALVAVRYRRSAPFLLGGLVVAGLAAGLALVFRWATPEQLGLGVPKSWIWTIALGLVWTGLMLAVSPLADRLATWLCAAPPDLGAFRSLQESKAKLIAGIVVAWILGGFLEELVFRGIVLNAVRAGLARLGLGAFGTAASVLVAASGAGVAHLYQGRRAAIIITQLSALFGTLFVAAGENLWPVVLCHGLYDTIAFIRFAKRKSKYSSLNEPGSPSGDI